MVYTKIQTWTQQITPILNILKAPFIIFILCSSVAYLYFERSIYFPRVIYYQTSIGSLHFQTWMWYILSISVIRCYYFNEFTFLWLIEARYVRSSVEKVVENQLTEIEKAYLSIRKLKSLLGKLERFHYRVCTVMNFVLKTMQNKGDERDDYSEAVQDLHYKTSKEETTVSDQELDQMVENVKLHCKEKIFQYGDMFDEGTLPRKKEKVVITEQHEDKDMQTLLGHLSEGT